MPQYVFKYAVAGDLLVCEPCDSLKEALDLHAVVSRQAKPDENSQIAIRVPAEDCLIHHVVGDGKYWQPFGYEDLPRKDCGERTRLPEWVIRPIDIP